MERVNPRNPERTYMPTLACAPFNLLGFLKNKNRRFQK